MPRGRPRKFDEEVVLNAAMMLFWEKGLSATSIDDLSDVMQMNKPSIYNAFGGKENIYRLTLKRFARQLDTGLEATFNSGLPLPRALIAFYNKAIDLYCQNDPSLGCLMICTAPSASLDHPEVGADLRRLIRQLDKVLAQHLLTAQKKGELSDAQDVAQLAKLLQAVLQSISLRARSGESANSLRKFAAYSVNTLTF